MVVSAFTKENVGHYKHACTTVLIQLNPYSLQNFRKLLLFSAVSEKYYVFHF